MAAHISPLDLKFGFCVGGPSGIEAEGDEPLISDRGAYE